jgi:hypothetical protein
MWLLVLRWHWNWLWRIGRSGKKGASRKYFSGGTLQLLPFHSSRVNTGTMTDGAQLADGHAGRWRRLLLFFLVHDAVFFDGRYTATPRQDTMLVQGVHPFLCRLFTLTSKHNLFHPIKYLQRKSIIGSIMKMSASFHQLDWNLL